MCGICGFCSPTINFNDYHSYYKELTQSMIKSIAHRGKDGSNTFICKSCCLGHSRLAIRDVNNGTQPMTKKFNNISATIVFNGEIYNTNELKKITDKYNIDCKTTCDTEIILNLYLTTGTKYINKINGIFAFAIYSEDKLILARDHIGVKPLYYHFDNTSFVFASEIKAIIAFGIKPQITDNDVRNILSIGPAHVPGETFFNNIKELLPGTFCTLDLRKKSTIPQFTSYWSLFSTPHTDTLEKTMEYIDYLINDSIKKQLVSDVPICSFLSGGLDSSLVSTIASKYISPEKLNTFSFDFTDNEKYYKAGDFQSSLDRPYVNIMKEFLNSNHKYLYGNTDDLIDKLFDCVDARDAPCMADIESSLFHFCNIVSKDYKVALTGECADEIFCGYPWYYKDTLNDKEDFPWSININERTKFFNDEFTHFLKIEETSKKLYLNELSKVPLSKEDDTVLVKHKQLYYLNIYWFMQMLLTRMDRASMYYSLEARVPFADYRIIEYMYNVPNEIVFYDNKPKGLLVKVGQKYLPNSIYNRKKSPYPKTYNPEYENKLTKILMDKISSSNSFLSVVCNKSKVNALLKGKSDYTKPWFGQLMSTPQLVAYLLQVDYFLSKYH
ncbi:MAG: asparagine synthase (glutamine-hydrolyzing) [Lachnospiraceae bacterium]|nr:asparagine synthase (glutamine-hydrolyzing) [Lachnospiraceae bacterium]